MARTRTVVVAGAGIGGLAAAIGLARVGFRALVLERADKLEDIGAGIQLSPNATRALSQLGVFDKLRPHAVEAANLIVGNGRTGAVLARLPLADMAARYGAPYLLALRGDLQRALLAAADDLADVEIERGATVTDAANHTRGITVSCQRDGRASEEIGQALIGADGLWSRVRERLHGAELPRFAGLVARRAVIPASRLSAAYALPDVRLWLGTRGHIVHYPVAGGDRINVVAISAGDWQGQGWDAESDTPFPGRWAEPAARLLAAASEYRHWTLADRPPLARWGAERTTLMGDAAHPMLPFLAQGAAAALEDAVVLSRRLADADDVPAALRAYEAERAPRTLRLQRTAQRTGALYRMRGPLALARNAALRLFGARRLHSRHDWIWRYDGQT
jgi:2-polyprenyl-6-methoxyphenol hydroxylase-like FAD-dependent oxidoreductase